MILYVVALRDSATEAFARPFYVSRPAEAVRSFGTECNRPHSDERPNPIYNHPSDYELWQLATFDDNRGEFTACPERLARAVDHSNK